ncbi:MAG: hypothetical protein RLY31_2817 [Bacteroidota bacterium]|jgi:hypothetical protein
MQTSLLCEVGKIIVVSYYSFTGLKVFHMTANNSRYEIISSG